MRKERVYGEEEQPNAPEMRDRISKHTHLNVQIAAAALSFVQYYEQSPCQQLRFLNHIDRDAEHLLTLNNGSRCEQN